MSLHSKFAAAAASGALKQQKGAQTLPDDATAHIGLFRFNSHSLPTKQLERLQEIAPFFTPERVKSVLLPVLDDEVVNPVSLRALDWLVTNFAKKHRIVYKVTPPGMPEELFNVFTSYHNWLWNYRRKNFDPFRRRQRVYVCLDAYNKKAHATTVGQLNFLYWASIYGVLDYARAHIKELEEDMTGAMRRRAESMEAGGGGGGGGGTKSSVGGKRKRRELTKNPGTRCFMYDVAVDVVFGEPPHPPVGGASCSSSSYAAAAPPAAAATPPLPSTPPAASTRSPSPTSE